MNYIKSLAIKEEKILTIVKFIVLIGIATVAPLFQQQMITGHL